MKKILLFKDPNVLLMFVMSIVFSLTACSKSDGEEVVTPPKQSETYDLTFPVNLLIDSERMIAMQNATSNVDNKIDALVLNSSNSMIYSIIDEKNYVIQGRGLPFDENDVVPLGFKAIENSSYEIEINNFDGLFENQDIYLRDKFIGAIHNLKSGKYYFLSEVGDFKNRFELLFKKPTISQNITTENQLMIFTNEGKIKLNSSNKKIQSIEVFDVLGKQIVSLNNIDNDNYIISNLSSSNQTLVVRVVLEDGNQITKKIIF